MHCGKLITCVIARSNPRRLFLFYAYNVGYCQSTMTPNCDVMSAKCVLHRAHERLSIYAMIVIPGQIVILSQG